jgi:hypothetical protein
MTLNRLLAALAFIVGAAGAGAQTPAPSSAPAPALLKSTCVKPDHFPGRLASDNNKRQWEREVKAWGECMKKYVADLQAVSDASIKAANASIEEYNAGIKEFQEETRKANDQ